MKFDTYTLRGHSINIPTPQTFNDVLELISSDHYRKCKRKLNGGGGDYQTLKRRCFSMV